MAIWVNKQRAGKRKLERGDAQPRITAGRVTKLEALGFAWGAQRDWEGQLARLVMHKSSMAIAMCRRAGLGFAALRLPLILPLLVDPAA